MIVDQWKPIPGYKGHYDVSDMGQVRSRKPSRQVRILKATGHFKNRYESVMLSINGRQERIAVHRLVGYSFCNPPEHWEDLQINHKNGIRGDNRAINLEWCTGSENMIHARDVLGTYDKAGENHHGAKLTADDVIEIRLRYATGGVSQIELANEYNISGSQICRIINRVRWGHI